MFAEDTNLFLTHEDNSYLSDTDNFQSEKTNQWLVYFK